MTKYNEDQRLQVARMLEDGMAVRAIAREMKISHNVIRNWRNRYEKGGIDQLLSTRQHYTAEFKLEAVAFRRQNGLSYPQAAAALGIPNQGTLYAWEKIFQLRGPEGLQDTRKGRLCYGLKRPLWKTPHIVENIKIVLILYYILYESLLYWVGFQH